jgi:hypothetical protein
MDAQLPLLLTEELIGYGNPPELKYIPALSPKHHTLFRCACPGKEAISKKKNKILLILAKISIFNKLVG